MIDPSSLGKDLSAWTHVRTNDPRPIDGVRIEGFCSKVYERTVGGEVWSLGQFFLYDIELHRAWGLKTDTHCSYHVLKAEPGKVRVGCPDLKLRRQDDRLLLTMVGDRKYVYEVRQSIPVGPDI